MGSQFYQCGIEFKQVNECQTLYNNAMQTNQQCVHSEQSMQQFLG